jgi:hypothetical protein
MTVYIEAQYDPERATVTLAATVEGDRYSVVMPAADEEAAEAVARDFIDTYRRTGVRVVNPA